MSNSALTSHPQHIKMELFYPSALIAGILVAFVLLVVVASYHDYFKAEIPPEVDQPLKFYLYHLLYSLMEIMVKTLDHVGILKEHLFIRFICDGLPALRDPKLLTKDQRFGEVPVRIYLPRPASASKRRAVIFIHGGCGMFGSIRSYEKVCRYIAKNTDSVVVSVGYRLAPEHEYPSQNMDCLSATVHFLQTAENYGVDCERVIICGDSAGATFSTSVCQELTNRTDLPKIRAQVMIYPFLQALNFNLPSYQKNALIPFLSQKRLIHFILKYLNKDSVLEEALLAGSHVPESINLKYGKWINADLIPDKFKQGYRAPPSTPCVAQVYEEVKEVFETTFSPLLAEDSVVCRLPDTCIVTCEHDVLRDDGLLYKKRLEDNEVPVTWHHLEEGFHGALGLLGYSIFSFPSSNKIIDYVVNFIKGY